MKVKFLLPLATALLAAICPSSSSANSNVPEKISVTLTEDTATTPKLSSDVSVNGSDLEIDHTPFTAIPEPAAAVLGGIGLLFLLMRRR